MDVYVYNTHTTHTHTHNTHTHRFRRIPCAEKAGHQIITQPVCDLGLGGVATPICHFTLLYFTLLFSNKEREREREREREP
jgi:hypothetical protein